MLSYDIRSVEQKAVSVEGVLEVDDPVWQEGDVRPSSPVQVTGRLSPAGTGTLYFAGTLVGTAQAECRRCLTDVTVPVSDEISFVYAEAEAEGADEPDVYPYDPQDGALDLAPAVREQWLLAVPGFALCREDCQGICPTCGADRNLGPCACRTKEPDPRWDALRALKKDA
jgi:uncharacterized protein